MKHCVAPVAPVNWLKAEAVSLRLWRESEQWRCWRLSVTVLQCLSHSSEQAPINLMEVLCLQCRKGSTQSPIGSSPQNSGSFQAVVVRVQILKDVTRLLMRHGSGGLL